MYLFAVSPAAVSKSSHSFENKIIYNSYNFIKIEPALSIGYSQYRNLNIKEAFDQ